MMKRILFYAITLAVLIGISNSVVRAQMGNLHGDDREYRICEHAGNQFRTTFFNDGTWGGNTANTAGMSIVSTQKPGEWPINSGHWYCIDGCTFILSEVADNYNPITRTFLTSPGTVRHVQSTVKAAPGGGTPGDKDPLTQGWWTFLPLAGFANPNDQIIAMAKGGQQWFNGNLGQGSWPPYWPDIRDPQNPYKIFSGDGWAGSWNGYFGRDKFNADEESYFVADDYAKQKFPKFRPDTNDVKRGGLGIRMYVRGFQWSKTAVQDALFIVSDLQNIGTYQHNKVVFGYKIGNNMGQTNGGSDAGDDGGSYSIQDNLSWTWDENGTGASDWGTTPVGMSAAALLETPGNPFDGIDNDNDGNPSSPNYGMKNRSQGAVTLNTTDGIKTFYAGSGPVIPSDLSFFAPRVLKLDDQIVLIDYKDRLYKRIVTTLRDTLLFLGKTTTDTLDISFGGFVYRFWEGDTLREVGDNLFDDNLNGVIDENRGVTNPSTRVTTYLYLGRKYIDYLGPDPTTNGSLNPLIDERRDDGVDNNGNWDVAKDDAGQDGLLGGDAGYTSPDIGEKDGLPTPGEVHFDKTDINESDIVGLTSFNLYQWNVADAFGTGKQDDDEGFWKRLAPGSFYAYSSAANVELLFGSGYFPLPPGYLERISYSFIVVSGPSGGWRSGGGAATPPDNLLQEKGQVQLAYDQNYNFSKPPDIPTITATIAGNNRVTLFWNTKAEQSVDPISGNDFEGYKIYRSTDPGWNDCIPITDVFGNVIWRKPVAQFDIDQTGQNPDYKGLAPVPYQAGGVFFWLGNNTGLRHYWIDTTAINGMKYYYAVTSYDHGDAVKGIDPAECSKFVAVNPDGSVQKGTNVAVVTPNAPAAGYVPADLDTSKIKPGISNTATGSINYKIINPDLIKDNHTYRISFSNKDSSYTTSSVLQNAALISLNAKATRGFTLVDTTSQDTILNNIPLYGADDEQLELVNREGFSLSFLNNPGFMWVNTNASANAGWNRSGGFPNFRFEPYTSGNVAKQQTVVIPSSDYKIMFGDVGIDTSTAFGYYVFATKRIMPPKPVNFTIVNTVTQKKVKFAFKEVDSTLGGIYPGVSYSGRTYYPGVFSFDSTNKRSDEIIILNLINDTVPSWYVRFQIDAPDQPDKNLPEPGDYLAIPLMHPFLTNDSFTFTTKAVRIDAEQAKTDMKSIRVVPNPYIVTNSWEPRNPYSSGRGTRQLHFTHLPQQCTIEIYTARGQLVKTIQHNSTMNDGTEVWDMLTKDNLDIAYGIYIYRVNAPGIGEKIDKFVVIK